MPNLADSFIRESFVRKLEKVEAVPDNLMTDWEVEFIESLRDSFESRIDAMDLGLNPWNPSLNQLNTLSVLSEKYA